MHRLVVGLIAIACSATPAFAESWLYLTDKSTGFKYDPISRQWNSVDFKTAKERYIIRPGSTKGTVYEVRKFGVENTPLPDAWCSEDFAAGTFLHCKGIMGEFKFNRKTGRFLKTYLAGYWTYAPGINATTESGDTPSIDIGTCSTI